MQRGWVCQAEGLQSTTATVVRRWRSAPPNVRSPMLSPLKHVHAPSIFALFSYPERVAESDGR